MSRKRQQNSVTLTHYPFLQHALQFQQLISSAALHLLVRTYFAAYLVAYGSLVASRTLVWKTFIAFRLLASQALLASKWLSEKAWSSRQATRLRKRLELELFVLLVGPFGNMLFLMLFWPGWLALGLALWAYWHVNFCQIPNYF